MKLARRYPGWWDVMPLEFSFAVGIIGAAFAALLPNAEIWVTKARLVEPLVTAANLRVGLMEHMALTGDGLQTNVVSGSKSDAADQTGNVEAALGAKRAGAESTEGRPDSRKAERLPEEVRAGSKLNISQEKLDEYAKYGMSIVDSSIVVRGTLGGKARPFQFTITPSIVSEGAIGSMLWLCGQKRPPPGWVQPAQGSSNLPVEYQFSVCRDSANH